MTQTTMSQSSAADDYSLEAVPTEARKGFWSMFFVMMGFTFFSASMSVGAKLGNGLELNDFIMSVVIGGIILGAYTGVLAYIGCDTGLTLDLLAQRSFGTEGSKLASAMISFTQIGWFGVGVAMFAIPAAQLLGINAFILVLIAGLLMTASAYFGIKALTIVSTISVPLIAVLGIYSMALSVNDGGGLISIFSRSSGSLSLLGGVGLVIGSFISGGTATPNFVRFAKNNTVAVLTTVLAFFLGNSLMFAFGAVGGAFTGKDDIFYVMIAQGLAIPALIVLGTNIWTTNNNALYTGGLGLSNITRKPAKFMVLISGIIGTLTAIWLYNNFVGWLSFLNATLPPVGAIVMLDYFIHRKSYRKNEAPRFKVHWGSVAGIVTGAIAGNFIHTGIASVNAMAVASICYLLADRLFYSPKTVQEVL